jgi:hypothetical protein
MNHELKEEELRDLYTWIDTIPLSRRKRNLARDFSDGVLMAEVVAHFLPRLVELHNYEQGLRVDTKIYNWKTLNNRVFKRLHYQLDTETIGALANSTPGVIEKVIFEVRRIILNRVDQDEHPFTEGGDPIELQIEAAKQCKDRKVLITKMKEIQEQGQKIQELEERIEKIQELIKLKDQRIQQLASSKRRKSA